MSMPTSRWSSLLVIFGTIGVCFSKPSTSHGVESDITARQPYSVTGEAPAAPIVLAIPDPTGWTTPTALLQPGDAEVAEGDDDAQAEDTAISDEGYGGPNALG